MSNTFTKLTPKQLYTSCPLKSFDFKTTADVKPLDGVIGQPRAVESIRFAIGMPHDGYNLFAFGREGTGKTSIVRRFIEHEAKDMPPPDGGVTSIILKTHINHCGYACPPAKAAICAMT